MSKLDQQGRGLIMEEYRENTSKEWEKVKTEKVESVFTTRIYKRNARRCELSSCHKSETGKKLQECKVNR